MAASFVPVFTRAGLAAIRSAQGNGLQAAISHLAVGRGMPANGGGWTGYAPDGTETALKGEIIRAPLIAGVPLGGVAGSDPIGFRVAAEFDPLPAGSAAASILEVGVILDDGTLLCLWSSAVGAANVIGALTANAVFDLSYDLYLTAVPVGSLTITILGEAPPDNLALLAELLRGVTRNYTRQMRAGHRLARRGIRE